MRIPLIILFLIFSSSIIANPDTILITKQDTFCTDFHYETGELKTRGCYSIENGEKKEEGTWIKYFQNGQIHDSTFFIKGNRIGIGKSYYPSGEIEKITHYENDKVSVLYFPKMGGSFEANYIPQGDTLIENGWFTTVSKTGTITDSIYYKMGTKTIAKHFYSNGTISEETKLAEDSKTLNRLVYNKNGKLKKRETYELVVNESGEKQWKKNGSDNSYLWFFIITNSITQILSAVISYAF